MYLVYTTSISVNASPEFDGGEEIEGVTREPRGDFMVCGFNYN
jgi:hypothetical protein